jgi:phage shock protein A
MVNETHAEYDENIEELKNRQETQEIAIRKTKEELVECEGGKTKITAQTKSLSRKIMANFIARMVHMRMA